MRFCVSDGLQQDDLDELQEILQQCGPGMKAVHQLDKGLYLEGLLVAGEPGDEENPGQAPNTSLLRLEHTLLQMAACEACQGVFYCLGVPSVPSEVEGEHEPQQEPQNFIR